MTDKTCFNCKLAVINTGSCGGPDEPPCPSGVEDCQAEHMTPEAIEKCESVDWDEEKCPELCGCFEPIMVNTCKCCGATINKPEFEHAKWVSLYENEPVCADNCKETLEALIILDELAYLPDERDASVGAMQTRTKNIDKLQELRAHWLENSKVLSRIDDVLALCEAIDSQPGGEY